MKIFLLAIAFSSGVVQAAQEPTWLADLQVVECRELVCQNLTTGEVYSGTSVDGYSVVFPDSYTHEQVVDIAPEVLEYITKNGLPITGAK